MIKIIFIIALVLATIIFLMWRDHRSDEENWHEREGKRQRSKKMEDLSKCLFCGKEAQAICQMCIPAWGKWKSNKEIVFMNGYINILAIRPWKKNFAAMMQIHTFY